MFRIYLGQLVPFAPSFASMIEALSEIGWHQLFGCDQNEIRTIAVILGVHTPFFADWLRLIISLDHLVLAWLAGGLIPISGVSSYSQGRHKLFPKDYK
jgi:hypothetical protein